MASGPAPSDMCPAGQEVAVAAYDLASGEHRWSACASDEEVRRTVVAATDVAVYVTVSPSEAAGSSPLVLDAGDGTELASPDPAPAPSLSVGTTPDGRATVESDGVRVVGGQDDPTAAVDAATGETLWEHPGSPAYDDVWAVGDGAVYVIDDDSVPGTFGMVAYELETGDVRWRLDDVDPYGAELGWPWLVRGEVLATIWSNLALLSTDDGSTFWRTDYPVVEFPRMTGVQMNDDTVLVAFSTVRSGGD